VQSFLITIAAFVFVIGVLIFIHELGHFVAAKFFKIGVEVFSLGFGPRLAGFRRGNTDYRVNAVPLGGYVKMTGENPEEINETALSPDAFLARPKWQRFCVALAGPAMNLLLAVAVPAALFMIDYKIPAYKLEKARVGLVVPGSPAEAAGIRVGDMIVDYDGHENPTWSEVEDITLFKPNQTISVTYERENQRHTTRMTLGAFRGGSEVLGQSGLLPPLPWNGAILSEVEKGSPADAAGLRPGDKIIQIDDTPVPAFPVLVAIVGSSAGKELTLTVVREGEQKQVKVTPFNDKGRGRIGVASAQPSVPMIETRLNPLRALAESFRLNRFYLWVTKEALVQIFQGQRTVRETFAGPLRIAEISGQAAQHGLSDLLSVMSLLSLSLGVFNLFPIPVLDGGLILMLAVEWLMGLAGKRLSVSLREEIQTVGFALIVILMGYIIYSDIAVKVASHLRLANEGPAVEQPSPQK